MVVLYIFTVHSRLCGDGKWSAWLVWSVVVSAFWVPVVALIGLFGHSSPSRLGGW